MKSDKSVCMETRLLYNLIMRKIAELTGVPEDNQNMTYMHGVIIEFLHDKQGKEVFQRDIENGFEIRRPTATKMLQSMERNGLIVRQGVSYDARLKQLILTEKAWELHTEMVKGFGKFEAALTAGLAKEELTAFFAAIAKIKQNLSQL